MRSKAVPCKWQNVIDEYATGAGYYGLEADYVDLNKATELTVSKLSEKFWKHH
jgi:hypothetical protein